MTLLVPFDGSSLAEAALVRATEFAAVFEEDVLAVTVVPADNADYARARDWLDDGAAFDLQAVVSAVHEQATALCPSADFRHKVVDRYASAGAIANRVRKVARDENASMVFIGSENAGHMVTGLSSVGGGIAADDSYDVVIVRSRSPAKIATLRDASAHNRSLSDFYLPE